jgi:hypothetical protein
LLELRKEVWLPSRAKIPAPRIARPILDDIEVGSEENEDVGLGSGWDVGNRDRRRTSTRRPSPVQRDLSEYRKTDLKAELTPFYDEFLYSQLRHTIIMSFSFDPQLAFQAEHFGLVP